MASDGMSTCVASSRDRSDGGQSRRTNGEDVADLGGIAQSYRAWRDRFASDPAGAKFDNFLLPGLELTRDQLFFVAFARGWARNVRLAQVIRLLTRADQAGRGCATHPDR